MARRRDQRGEPREQLDRREAPVARVLARSLARVGDSSVAKDRETLERERGSRAVPSELLARDVVVCADAHGGVEIVAVEQGGLLLAKHAVLTHRLRGASGETRGAHPPPRQFLGRNSQCSAATTAVPRSPAIAADDTEGRA
jgi:transposase InsO family protein